MAPACLIIGHARATGPAIAAPARTIRHLGTACRRSSDVMAATARATGDGSRDRDGGREQHVAGSPSAGTRELSDVPIWAATMAGGRSAPALVVAAARPGAVPPAAPHRARRPPAERSSVDGNLLW